MLRPRIIIPITANELTTLDGESQQFEAIKQSQRVVVDRKFGSLGEVSTTVVSTLSIDGTGFENEQVEACKNGNNQNFEGQLLSFSSSRIKFVY